MLVNKVISNYKKNYFNKKTIKASIKAKYKGKSNLPSVNVSLRIKKDEVIWMSITKFIKVGKLKITPKKVQFYNNLTNEFFDGDFTLLSNFLGTEINFEQVQNILIGQAVYNLNEKHFNIEPKENSFIFTPKRVNKLFDVLFQLDALTFKLKKQQVSQKEQSKLLTINYSNYQKIDGVFFPKNVFVKASEKNSENTIDIQYKKISFNDKLNFPFKIPNGYKEIEL